MFTLTDKALLERASRLVAQRAGAVRIQNQDKGWPSGRACKAAKAEYDRLLRDERDLRELGRRMTVAFKVAPAQRKIKVAAAPAVEDPQMGELVAGVEVKWGPASDNVLGATPPEYGGGNG